MFAFRVVVFAGLALVACQQLLAEDRNSRPLRQPARVKTQKTADKSALLAPGDHVQTLTVDGRERSYLVHVPPAYNSQSPTPVLLVFHGARMNARLMAEFTGMHRKSDEAGFIAVYPNGFGSGVMLTFNAGGLTGPAAAERPDDVRYVAALLDDLPAAVNVDTKRIYATGISNGGMMCYRLAAELSERFAAIAAVAGTMVLEDPKPTRPVPVLHMHGTEDQFMPYDGPSRALNVTRFRSVDDTVAFWVRHNGCPAEPKVTKLPDVADDGTQVLRKEFGPGRDDAEVVLYQIEGGGHTWPGRKSPLALIGKSTLDIAANDVIWDFCKQHKLK